MPVLLENPDTVRERGWTRAELPSLRLPCLRLPSGLPLAGLSPLCCPELTAVCDEPGRLILFSRRARQENPGSRGGGGAPSICQQRHQQRTRGHFLKNLKVCCLFITEPTCVWKFIHCGETILSSAARQGWGGGLDRPGGHIWLWVSRVGGWGDGMNEEGVQGVPPAGRTEGSG